MVTVMAWCCQATSHYLSKCWTRFMLPYGITVVCSTPLLAPHIGLYTTSLVSLTDVLIGWRASDCDAPTQLLSIQINTGNTAPSPTWRASPTWRKQKAFPLPETVALWVLWKSREFPAFFRGRGQSYTRRHGTWNSLVSLGHRELYH